MAIVLKSIVIYIPTTTQCMSPLYVNLIFFTLWGYIIRSQKKKKSTIEPFSLAPWPGLETALGWSCPTPKAGRW